MKAPRCNSPVILACLLASLLPGMSISSFAQTTPAASTRVGSADGPGYLLEIKDQVLQPKGQRKQQPANLQNLVDLLREEFPGVNIVITPGIAEVTIDHLKLRAASLEDQLEALSVASGGLFIWEKRRPYSNSPQTGASPQHIDPTSGLPLPAGYPGAGMPQTAPAQIESDSSLYILREPTVPVESRRKVEAFNLSGYLKNSNKSVPDSLKEIERIVADTFEEMKGPQAAQNRPTFKFHAGANLLIVVGPQEAIEIARQVVNALPGQEPRGVPPYGMDSNVPGVGGRYPGAATDPFLPARR